MSESRTSRRFAPAFRPSLLVQSHLRSPQGPPHPVSNTTDECPVPPPRGPQTPHRGFTKGLVRHMGEPVMHSNEIISPDWANTAVVVVNQSAVSRKGRVNVQANPLAWLEL